MFLFKKRKPKEFKSLNNVKEWLQDTNSLENFTDSKHLLLYSNEYIRLWTIATKMYIYFVLDNKEKINILYSNRKKDFEYMFLQKDRPKFGEILFLDRGNSLTFDRGITGNDITFENNLKELLKDE